MKSGHTRAATNDYFPCQIVCQLCLQWIDHLLKRLKNVDQEFPEAKDAIL